MPVRAFRSFLSPEIVLIVVTFAALVVLQGARLNELLWTDEIITRRNLSVSWIELAQDRYWAGHSPLYFALMKLWALAISGINGMAPGELSAATLRLPSLAAIGVAGGLLAAGAWRVWAPLCGVLFFPLWVFSPMIGRYAVEARPWAFLLLALAVSLWSVACLWSRSERSRSADDRCGSLLWLASFASPIFAAATLPVGIPAVAVTELTVLTLAAKSKNKAFFRRWRRRTLAVLASVAVTAAFIAPAVRHKATNYWADAVRPFSVESVQDIVAKVVLQNTDWLGAVLIVLVACGAYFRRNDFLGRAAIGLAIVFPLLMIGVSVFKSVLVARYFLPALPGLYLLAAGAADRQVNVRTVLAMISVVLVAFAFFNAPSLSRVHTTRAAQHLSVLQRLGVNEIEGLATHPHLATVLEHYIPRRLNVPVKMGYVKQPLKEDELPDGKVLWVFGHRKRGSADAVVGGVKTLCYFGSKNSQIYVVARAGVQLPFDASVCDPLP